MRTIVLAAVLAAMLGCAATSVPLPAPGVRIWESRDDSAISEGETTLATDPASAYAAATDYSHWPTIFADVARVDVTDQRGVDARVTFVYRDGHRDNLHFHNRPDTRTLWFEDTGGRAEVWAEIAFTPGPVPGTTHVHSRLYADVHGLASLVVTDARLRAMRQQRISSDLFSLQTYFMQQLALRHAQY
jgi:hypothetical protein